MAEFSFVLSLTERCRWMDIEKERKRGADRQTEPQRTHVQILSWRNNTNPHQRGQKQCDSAYRCTVMRKLSHQRQWHRHFLHTHTRARTLWSWQVTLSWVERAAASSWFHGDTDTNFKPTPLSLVPIFGQSPPPAPTLPSIKSVTPQTK